MSARKRRRRTATRGPEATQNVDRGSFLFPRNLETYHHGFVAETVLRIDRMHGIGKTAGFDEKFVLISGRNANGKFAAGIRGGIPMILFLAAAADPEFGSRDGKRLIVKNRPVNQKAIGSARMHCRLRSAARLRVGWRRRILPAGGARQSESSNKNGYAQQPCRHEW